jgi:hypothetical protein
MSFISYIIKSTNKYIVESPLYHNYKKIIYRNIYIRILDKYKYNPKIYIDDIIKVVKSRYDKTYDKTYDKK